MMDRMWTFWFANMRICSLSLLNTDFDSFRQALDPQNRLSELSGGDYGHVTWANNPPSRKASLQDVIDMGYTGKSISIGEVMDTLSGPLCYFYL